VIDTADKEWWRDAVVYQLYLRSFADGDGDGIGDLAGVRSRLDHIERLGVDAIWLNPCYESPQRDHGYDISNYFRIDPAYGTLDEFEGLVRDAGSRDIRVLMDMVANHCSSDHEWFQAACFAEPGSNERARFHFADGRGVDGSEPPNNYGSVFGGSAWTRVTEPDGTLGQWYLHLFDSSQPDLNWSHPDVKSHFDDVLTFWFDKGVAGFRIDVAHGMAKADSLPDVEEGADSHPAWDQTGVHDIHRTWRRLADCAPGGPRYLVGEVWASDTAFARYISPDELHQAFAFDLLVQPWHESAFRSAIDRSLALAGGTRPAWTLSNHDVHRTVTRYGQDQDLTPPDPSDLIGSARRRGRVNLEVGTRRAAAAAMIELALPGSVYLYQGEELGLPEVLDLPDNVRQDPLWHRSAGSDFGRDGCRVPMPWEPDAPSFGFSPRGAVSVPWLPQPETYGTFAATAQYDVPGSMFSLFERLLRARRELFEPDAPLKWLQGWGEGVLAFRRGSAVCAANFSDSARTIPSGFVIVESSVLGSRSDSLSSDSAVWMRLNGDSTRGVDARQT